VNEFHIPDMLGNVATFVFIGALFYLYFREEKD